MYVVSVITILVLQGDSEGVCIKIEGMHFQRLLQHGSLLNHTSLSFKFELLLFLPKNPFSWTYVSLFLPSQVQYSFIIFYIILGHLASLRIIYNFISFSNKHKQKLLTYDLRFSQRDIAPCSPYMNRSFAINCYIHLQGRKSAKQETSTCLATRWILAMLIFDLENGSDSALRNVGSHTDYRALHTRRWKH
jgi:hypothetical protein